MMRGSRLLRWEACFCCHDILSMHSIRPSPAAPLSAPFSGLKICLMEYGDAQ
jgi:uncharacterized CHY-type Zn-finger protein